MVPWHEANRLYTTLPMGPIAIGSSGNPMAYSPWVEYSSYRQLTATQHSPIPQGLIPYPPLPWGPLLVSPGCCRYPLAPQGPSL